MDTIDAIINIIKAQFPKLYITTVIDDNLKFHPENDDGHIEYKRKLSDCTDIKSAKYTTQMRWRIMQNMKGQYAIYYIGVDDDGSIIGLDNDELVASIKKFVSIADVIGASITGIKIISTNNKIILQIGVKNKKLRDNYLVEFD